MNYDVHPTGRKNYSNTTNTTFMQCCIEFDAIFQTRLDRVETAIQFVANVNSIGFSGMKIVPFWFGSIRSIP